MSDRSTRDTAELVTESGRHDSGARVECVRWQNAVKEMTARGIRQWQQQ
jgi:hypothetical protein